MSFVSVIIPNYDHAAYLKIRIDSVLNQTYKDFEVIILDDCSADNSKDIIESYRSNKNVSHIVYNETNSGSTFKQWQKGIGLAKGKYIWIAESDDMSAAIFLETAVGAMEQVQNAALFFCQSNCIDFDGKPLEDMHWWTNSIKVFDWHKPFIANLLRFIYFT